MQKKMKFSGKPSSKGVARNFHGYIIRKSFGRKKEGFRLRLAILQFSHYKR